jgi:hypothetical protein
MHLSVDLDGERGQDTELRWRALERQPGEVCMVSIPDHVRQLLPRRGWEAVRVDDVARGEREPVMRLTERR